MKTFPIEFKKHLLICTRVKEGKPCCGAKDSQQMVDNLKGWIKDNSLKDKIRVTGTQCLSHCENGITAILYPEGKCLTGLTLSDEEFLKNTLVN